jgi:hypothetical protein
VRVGARFQWAGVRKWGRPERGKPRRIRRLRRKNGKKQAVGQKGGEGVRMGRIPVGGAGAGVKKGFSAVRGRLGLLVQGDVGGGRGCVCLLFFQ